MSNKKFIISDNSILGRHLISVSDVRAGELILTEKPVLVGPKWGSKPCCLNCYRKSANICPDCNMAPLCLACNEHDESECALYKISDWSPEFVLNNFDIVTPVRVLLLSNTDQILFGEIIKMEDGRLIARRDTKLWKLHEKYIVAPIMNTNMKCLFPNIENLDAEFIQKICAILDDAIEVRGGREILPDKAGNDPSFMLRGLYRHPPLLVHNCLANSFMTVDADFNVRLYAGQDIKNGDVISYNYSQILLGTKERRTQLEKSKNFICNCKRCLDPKELGTYIGSIQCMNCKDGLCSFMEGYSWICEKCNQVSDPKKVEELLEQAKTDLISLSEDSYELQEWIDKYSLLLSPKHWIVIDVKQILAKILKIECGDGKNSSLKMLKRKLELYEEIVPIIKTLRPGLSKMLGIVLYDYQYSLVQVAQKMFDSGNIIEEELIENLLKAENILKESIRNLVFEHKTTPEGQLCKRALVQLKDLRVLIEEIKIAAAEKAQKQETSKKAAQKKQSKKSKNKN